MGNAISSLTEDDDRPVFDKSILYVILLILGAVSVKEGVGGGSITSACTRENDVRKDGNIMLRIKRTNI